MSVATITINRAPVYRATYDAASDAAKLQAEIFERLIELDNLKHDQAPDLCRRLATLADLSPYAFRLVLRVGSGDLASVLASYEDMSAPRGITKQAVHYELSAELNKIKFVFPEIARVLHQYRDHATRHHREQADGESARDVSAGHGGRGGT